MKNLIHQFLNLFFSSSDLGEETKKGDSKMNDDLQTFIQEASKHIDTPIMLSTELAPLIKKAEKGDIDAIIKLGYAFMEGENAKVNDELAIHYFEQLFEVLDSTQYLARYYAQYNMARIEASRNDYEELKNRFYNLTKLMLNEFPFEEWRFDDFAWMKDCVDSQGRNI